MKNNFKNLFKYCILPILEIAILLMVACLILWLFNGGNLRDYTGSFITNIGLVLFSMINLIHSNADR